MSSVFDGCEESNLTVFDIKQNRRTYFPRGKWNVGLFKEFRSILVFLDTMFEGNETLTWRD